MPRLAARLIAVATLGLCYLSAATAKPYPERPIRLVVPYAAGGTSDMIARLLAAPLRSALGQTIVVDNRPGAGSNVGSEIVAKSAPDGYTLLMGTPALSSNPTLYGKVNYDPQKSFAPITLVAEIPIVLVVRPDLSASSVAELIAFAKANPGKLNFGSSGNGGIGHLVGELFRSLTGIDMVHVPFKGNGPALVALMSGAIDLTFSDIAGASPHIKSGKLRPLAVTSTRRSSIFPQLPTMAEAGVPGFIASSWFAVFTTAGTPAPIIETLNHAIVRVLESAEINERMTGLGFEVAGSTPDQLRAFLESEIRKWSKVVKESGARVQ